MAASCGESCPRGPIFPGRVTCLGCSLACWWRGLPPRSGETRWSPSWAPAVLVGDRILRVGEAALTVLDHETLAGRDVAIAYVHLIEHLEVGLPALRRDHMADIAALVIEEFDVRILGEERLERVVGIEAIPSRGDGRRHELNAQRRGVGVVKILLEFPGPVVVHVTGDTFKTLLTQNPHIKFFNNQRGYVRHVVTPERWQADFQVLDQVNIRDGHVSTRKSFMVEYGKSG